MFYKDVCHAVTDAAVVHIVCSEGEEGCKKQLDRVLSIWQERAVYENDLLEKLSEVLRKYTWRCCDPKLYVIFNKFTGNFLMLK